MLWIIVGLGALAAWYFTSQVNNSGTPTPIPTAGVTVGSPGSTSGAQVVTTTNAGPSGAPIAVSDHPTGVTAPATPANATTPQAQLAMNNFQGYVAKFQPPGWNGLLLPQQWNYYYAQGSGQTTHQQNPVLSTSVPINVNAYWAQRAAKGLSL